mmetsp:Transcript_10498/g.32616  ORF Transcript_10498/g.32616 Transcript_10498/m.32616 type:complete len:216 (+) Transcript_10498:93-740(+)
MAPFCWILWSSCQVEALKASCMRKTPLAFPGKPYLGRTSLCTPRHSLRWPDVYSVVPGACVSASPSSRSLKSSSANLAMSSPCSCSACSSVKTGPPGSSGAAASCGLCACGSRRAPAPAWPYSLSNQASKLPPRRPGAGPGAASGSALGAWSATAATGSWSGMGASSLGSGGTNGKFHFLFSWPRRPRFFFATVRTMTSFSVGPRSCQALKRELL